MNLWMGVGFLKLLGAGGSIGHAWRAQSVARGALGPWVAFQVSWGALGPKVVGGGGSGHWIQDSETGGLEAWRLRVREPVIQHAAGAGELRVNTSPMFGLPL